jgi:hypothetical protein
MVFAQHAAGGGSYPLIILLLLAAWLLFAVAAPVTVWQILCEGSGWSRRVLWAMVAGVALAGVLALIASPGIPVVCTYTGLSHITSAYHLAELEWQWPFPTDYPLTVPALAAAFVLVMGKVPEAMGLANLVLTLLAVAGVGLLAGTLWRSRVAPWGATLALATAPLLLLFARGDGLSVGYLALSPWAAVLALRVARGEGGVVARFGLVAALLLAIQARAEGIAFLAVVAAVPLTMPRDGWRVGAGRLWSLMGLAALLLVPHVVNLAAEFAGADRSLAAEIGFHTAWKTLLGTGFLAAGIVLAGSVVRVRPTPIALSLALLALLITGLTALFGVAVYSTETQCWGVACNAQSYRTVALWLVSPKLMSLVVPGLALVGAFAFRSSAESRGVAWLVLWGGGMVAVASVKMTGELPYEGARTQLPALAPLVVLAALGVHRLVMARGHLCVRVAAVLVAGLVVTLYVPFRTLGSHGYDEQVEFQFVRDCLDRLPEHSVIVAPDDALNVMMLGDTESTRVDLYHLYRTAYLAEALGEASKRARVVPFGALASVLSGERPVFWFRSLNCYRTGDGSLTPSCQRALAMPGWQPVCEQSVKNRPYTADFFEETRVVGHTIVLGIYAHPGQGKEAHAVP